MKPKTQFKINEEHDIIRIYYANADCFTFDLENEITDYRFENMIFLICDEEGKMSVDNYISHFETIPNPYTEEQEPNCELGKALKKAETEANKLGMKIEFVFNQINK